MIGFSQTRRPLWIGVVVAPWAGPSAFLVYATVDSLAKHKTGGLSLWALMALAYYVVGLPVSYATMLGLGLPYVRWLRRRNQLGWLQICLGATVCGALAFAVVWSGNQMHAPLGSYAAVGAALGLLSGIVFCVAVGPNKSFKPTPLRGSA